MTLGSRISLTYLVDIVFCVDATASTGPVINTVRKLASTFHVRLEDMMADRGKAIRELRIKVIAFRDFGSDATDAIEQTDFLAIPRESHQFELFLSQIKPRGGGDIPESGLEALALAIASPWRKPEPGNGVRQIIVLFTDAPAHPLGSPNMISQAGYPQYIPTSDEGLLHWWAGPRSLMHPSSKRLILFAPDAYPWNNIASEWEYTIHFPSDAGSGLEEFELEEVLSAIVNSL